MNLKKILTYIKTITIYTQKKTEILQLMIKPNNEKRKLTWQQGK